MSSKQYLIDASTKHQVFLQRYAGSTYKQMTRFIDKAKAETLTRLQYAHTALDKNRYRDLLIELTNINKALYNDMGRSVKKQMVALATYEATFTEKLVKKASNIPFETVSPTVKQLESAAFTSIMDAVPGFKPTNGITVGSALSDFGSKKAGDVVQAVRVGFATGKTIDDISKSIVELQPMIYRQARALAQTITNHVAAQSRHEFYKDNSDLVTAYQVVATLDDRTTIECAALDGKIFSPDEFEEPPYHWNCRTTFIGIVDPQYDVGSALDGGRPAVGSEGAEDVSSKTTYNSWLKTQPDHFQDEVLGKTKGELFRAGASLDKFVDHNYQPLTLDELKGKDDMHVFFDKI